MDIKTAAANALEFSARILFPPLCVGCRNIVSRPGTLCGSCWRDLSLLEKPWCAVLGTPFSYDFGENAVSPEAMANPPSFDRARAAAAYSGAARQLVHGLKFQDRPELARWMADWMVRAGAELLAEADMLVPIPLHRSRFLARRFNQSAELARAIARLGGVPVDHTILRRVRRTRQQVGLGARERQANVRGAFVVAPEAATRIAGRKVLLIDDVYTTGATVSAAARILKRKGARGVDVLTFARVLERDFQSDAGDPI